MISITKRWVILLVQLLAVVVANMSTHHAKAQTAPGWQWARTGSGISNEIGTALSTTPQGQVVMVGNFFSQIRFSAGVTLSNPNGRAAFVAQYDSTGSPLWARRIGSGSGNISAGRVSAIPTGDLCIAGAYKGLITLGSTTLTTSGHSASSLYFGGYVVWYDAQGRVVWARDIAGDYIYPVEMAGIQTDAAGNVYIAGTFANRITIGATSLSTVGAHSGFLAKLDDQGTLQWLRVFQGLTATCASMKLDGQGNVYLVGNLAGSVTFPPLTVVGPPNNLDAYIAKFDAAGNAVWVQLSGNPNGSVWPLDVAVDQAGNISVTGFVNRPCQLGALTHTPSADDVFIAHLNGSGSVEWAHFGGGLAYDQGQRVVIDPEGSSYVYGSFQQAAHFGQTVNYNVYANDSTEIFLVKYDAVGDIQWVQQSGGTFSDIPTDIVLSSTGQLYTSGAIRDAAQFGSIFVTCNTGSDAFLARVATPPLLSFPDEVPSCQWNVYPNPVTDGRCFLTRVDSYSQPAVVELGDQLGRVILKKTWSEGSSLELDVENITPGVYFLSTRCQHSVQRKRLVIR